MKEVNFLRTLSPKEQQTIRTWYYRTWYIGIILFICMFGMHIPQFYRWRLLKKQQIKHKIVPSDALNQEVQALEKQLASLTDYTVNLKKDEERLVKWRKRVTYLFESNFALQSCDIDAKSARLVVNLSSLDQVKKLTATLSACPLIKAVQVHSLVPLAGGKGYVCNCSCEWGG